MVHIILSILFFLTVSLSTSAQLTDREVRDLKSGRSLDDSSFIYSLPFLKGNSYLLIQGSNSKFSHKCELAFDFKMQMRSKICAARSGKVVAARSDSKEGGLKQANLSDGNYIFIEHEDGSVGQYWHLDFEGLMVKIGDMVETGQVIGLSGNTGYSAFPHLHFQVFDKNGRNILVRFRTKKGVKYIRAGRYHRAV